MRLGSSLRFLALGSCLLVIGLLLSKGTWGACPDTERYKCLCPYPATTVDCTQILDKGTCMSQKGQARQENYWDCKSGSGTECLNGTEEKVCYKECDCYWNDNNQCAFDLETTVDHNAVLKKNVDCPSES